MIDGNHLLATALRCGIETIPAQLVEGLSGLEAFKLAIRSNEASETVVPTTFVDIAEFIWKLDQEGKKDKEIAEILGWNSRSQFETMKQRLS